MVNPISGSSPVSENQYNPSQDPATSYNAAVADFNKQDYVSAYNNLLAASKDQVFAKSNPMINYLMGLAAAYSNKPNLVAKAKGYLENYLKIANSKTDKTTIQSAKGQIDLLDAGVAQNNNDLEGMITAYEKAGKDDPSMAPSLKSTIDQLKGQKAQQAGNIDQAIKFYEQAIKDDPKTPQPQLQSTIYQLKAGQAGNQGNYAQCIQYYQQAIEADPNQATQLKAAIEQTQVSEDVNNALQKAQSLFYPPQGTGQTGDQAGAISVLLGILQKYPNLSQYNVDPSTVYAPLAQDEASMVMYTPDGTQGHPEEAVRILQSAISEHPGVLNADPSILYRTAQYAWAAGHIDQARDLFNQFQPYQAQYEQSYGDTTGPAAFNEQLSGNAQAVMSNFSTYASNWISKHLLAIVSFGKTMFYQPCLG